MKDEDGTGTPANSWGSKTAASIPMIFLVMKKWWHSFLGHFLVKLQAQAWRKLGKSREDRK